MSLKLTEANPIFDTLAMALRTPPTMFSSQDKFEEYIQKLSRMDLFDLAPPYSKTLFAKGLSMFRSGHAGVEASIQKIDNSIQFQFSHQDKVQNTMFIRPTQGRIPVFEGFQCACAQFAEVGQCEHLISSHLLLWGSSQDESSLKKKYGLCPENENNIQEFRGVIRSFRSRLAEKPAPAVQEEIPQAVGAGLVFTVHSGGPLHGCLKLMGADANEEESLDSDPQILQKVGLRHRPSLTEERRDFFRAYSPQKIFDYPHLESSQFDFFIAYDHYLRRHSADDGSSGLKLQLKDEPTHDIKELRYLSQDPKRRISTGQIDWSCQVRTTPGPAIDLGILNTDNSEVLWGPNWIFEISAGRLWVHPLWILQSVHSLQSAPFLKGTKTEVSFSSGEALSEWFMSAMTRIEKTSDHLQFSEDVQTLAAAEIEFECNISDTAINLVFRQKEELLGLPWFKPIQDLAVLTAQGFSSLVEIQRLLPDHTSRQVLRSLDQKLVHHRGISLLFQVHLLKALFQQGEWFKDFCADAGPLLQPTSKLTKKVYRLSDLLSDRVLDALEASGNRILHELRADFYLLKTDRAFRIQGLGERLAAFWTVMLAHLGAQNQSYDDTIRFHEPLFAPLEKPYSLELNPVGLFSGWSLLKWAEFADDAKAELTYQNQKILRAEPTKFKAQFNVEEGLSDSSGTGPRSPMEWFELDSRFFLNGQELTLEQSEGLLK
ncbi:MAG: hypothetical protein K2X47_06475, partial [Bdellovibrionales bacterium]|nr:hypothetical protein [Bdellovibrionales bacterium]